MGNHASVTSEPHPQQGQNNRSSGNFSTQELTGSKLIWSCPRGIVFQVMEDIPNGYDPVIFDYVTDGTETKMYSARSLYIANPHNATSNFTVSVEGV